MKKIISATKNYILILLIFNSAWLMSQNIDIINPKKNIGINNWIIVNDNVMGGVSNSTLSLNNENNLVFNGNVSLENNGGFASVRHGLKKGVLKGVKTFKIVIKGDGNIYKLRFRQQNRRAAYSSDFRSKDGEWIEVEIQVKNLIPSWRGYYYNDYPEIDLEKINSLGIQISDKQEGSFELEIKSVVGVY